jgi:hypothetical protein
MRTNFFRGAWQVYGTTPILLETRIEVTPMPRAKKVSSPMPIAQDLLWGGWSALAADTAVELDLFTIIHRGKTTASEISEEAKTHESSTRRLLHAMVALRYLTRKKDCYGLAAAAATILVRAATYTWKAEESSQAAISWDGPNWRKQ